MDMSSPNMSMGTAGISMNSPDIGTSPPDMNMSPPDMNMRPPDMSMDTDMDSTDMSPPDAEMSTTTDAPMEDPPMDMDSNIISSTETPSDYYAPEYIILAVLYLFIALLYIVESQINVGLTINGWLRAHPDYINLSLATLYSFISIVYIVFFHLPQDTIGQSNLKVFGTVSILLILVYAWIKLVRRGSMSPIRMLPRSL